MQISETLKGDQEVETDLEEDMNLLKGKVAWVGFDAAQKFTELIAGCASTQWVKECCVGTF